MNSLRVSGCTVAVRVVDSYEYEYRIWKSRNVLNLVKKKKKKKKYEYSTVMSLTTLARGTTRRTTWGHYCRTPLGRPALLLAGRGVPCPACLGVRADERAGAYLCVQYCTRTILVRVPNPGDQTPNRRTNAGQHARFRTVSLHVSLLMRCRVALPRPPGQGGNGPVDGGHHHQPSGTGQRQVLMPARPGEPYTQRGRVTSAITHDGEILAKVSRIFDRRLRIVSLACSVPTVSLSASRAAAVPGLYGVLSVCCHTCLCPRRTTTVQYQQAGQVRPPLRSASPTNAPSRDIAVRDRHRGHSSVGLALVAPASSV